MSASSNPPPSWHTLSAWIAKPLTAASTGLRKLEKASSRPLSHPIRCLVHADTKSTIAQDLACMDVPTPRLLSGLLARLDPLPLSDVLACETRNGEAMYLPQNGPELVRTTANIVGLRSSWLSASANSAIKACDSAFLLLGLFSSSMATPPSWMDTTSPGSSEV